MIAAEIGEDIGDLRLLQRLEHRHTGRVHSYQLSILRGALNVRGSGF